EFHPPHPSEECRVLPSRPMPAAPRVDGCLCGLPRCAHRSSRAGTRAEPDGAL
ncbi:MAG: diguanylate cyclase/phosphodiesterase (GGDEF & EAL domains) with PAS/PAC sensor(s), partial [uncultured Blastococcus sp.]